MIARADGARRPRVAARRYELRWPSFVYVATAIFLAVGAFNSQNNLLYWIFGVAVCAVLVGGIISGSSLMRLEVSREPAPEARAGRPFSLRYAVRNRHRWLPLVALAVEEVLPAGSLARLETATAVVTHCGPRERVLVSAQGHALARGRAPLGRVRVTTSFPFGLVRKIVEFEDHGEILVLPATAPVRRELMDTVRTASRFDAQALSRAGLGEEFFGLRTYTPGDPMRRIAWKRSAALGTLVVHQTAAPSEARVWVDLDGAVRAASPEAFERAMAAAASLAGSFIERGMAVGLRAPWMGLWVAPASGPGSTRHLHTVLARLEPGSGSGAPPRGATGRSGAVVTVGLDAGASGAGVRVDATDAPSWCSEPDALPAVLAPRTPQRGRSRRWRP